MGSSSIVLCTVQSTVSVLQHRVRISSVFGRDRNADAPVSPNLLGALNVQGYFETSSPAWKAVLGWSDEEVARMSIFEMLHPDDVERTRAGFALTQAG